MKISKVQTNQRRSLKFPVNFHQNSLCSFQKKKKIQQNVADSEQLIDKLSKKFVKYQNKQTNAKSFQCIDMHNNFGRFSYNQKKILQAKLKTPRKKQGKNLIKGVSINSEQPQINKAKIKKTNTDSHMLQIKNKINNSTFETELTQKTEKEIYLKTQNTNIVKKKSLKSKNQKELNSQQVQTLLYLQYFTNNTLSLENYRKIRKFFNNYNIVNNIDVPFQAKFEATEQFQQYLEWQKKFEQTYYQFISFIMYYMFSFFNQSVMFIGFFILWIFVARKLEYFNDLIEIEQLYNYIQQYVPDQVLQFLGICFSLILVLKAYKIYARAIKCLLIILQIIMLVFVFFVCYYSWTLYSSNKFVQNTIDMILSLSKQIFQQIYTSQNKNPQFEEKYFSNQLSCMIIKIQLWPNKFYLVKIILKSQKDFYIPSYVSF